MNSLPNDFELLGVISVAICDSTSCVKHPSFFKRNIVMRPSYTRRPSSRESSSSSDSSSEEDCKVYGTDDDEQEDPKDYRKGSWMKAFKYDNATILYNWINFKVGIILWKLEMCTTSDMKSSGNWAGDISRRFGFLGTEGNKKPFILCTCHWCTNFSDKSSMWRWR